MRTNAPAMLLATGFWVCAGTAGLQAAASTTAVSAATKNFMVKAAQDSMAEVRRLLESPINLVV